MKVVHLASEDDNYIEIGEAEYFLLRDAELGCYTVSAKCPHRGGPLHLGEVDETGRFMICPWHKSRTSIERLLANGLPTVCKSGQITVIAGSDATATSHTYQRRMLIDCTKALAPVRRKE